MDDMTVVKEILEEITGFQGSFNVDMTDFIRVLSELAKEHRHQLDIVSIVGLPQPYVNLIYAVCCDCDLIDWEYNLQGSFITDLGRDVLRGTFAWIGDERGVPLPRISL